jgi:hypothetical protein
VTLSDRSTIGVHDITRTTSIESIRIQIGGGIGFVCPIALRRRDVVDSGI